MLNTKQISHAIDLFTDLCITAFMNSSMKSSYSSPVTRFCLSPIYSGSLISAWRESYIMSIIRIIRLLTPLIY